MFQKFLKNFTKILKISIRSQYTLSLPPENIRKPYGSLMFSGVEKGCTGNEWVNAKIDYFDKKNTLVDI